MSEFSVRLENTFKQVLGNLQIILGDFGISLAMFGTREACEKNHQMAGFDT